MISDHIETGTPLPFFTLESVALLVGIVIFDVLLLYLLPDIIQRFETK